MHCVPSENKPKGTVEGSMTFPLIVYAGAFEGFGLVDGGEEEGV